MSDITEPRATATAPVVSFRDIVADVAADIDQAGARMAVTLSTGRTVCGEPHVGPDDDFLTLRIRGIDDPPTFVNLAHIITVSWAEDDR